MCLAQAYFDYLQHNAEAAVTFNQGMTNLSSMLAYAVLMAYDFTGISSIADIGGGEGQLLRKILELNPEMRGAVLDVPANVETTNQDLDDQTCRGRYSYVAGDFFDSVPEGADAYLLCGVIHDWDDDSGCYYPQKLPQSYGKEWQSVAGGYGCAGRRCDLFQ
jgi:O-methyltransferase domain